MKNRKFIWRIAVSLLFLVIIIYLVADIIMSCLKRFSDYHLTNYEIIALCTVIGVFAKAGIDHLQKEHYVIKTETQKVSNINKNIDSLDRDVRHYVSEISDKINDTQSKDS